MSTKQNQTNMDNDRKKHIGIILVISLVICLVIVITWLLLLKSCDTEPASPVDGPDIKIRTRELNGETYEFNHDVKLMLFLGVDRGNSPKESTDVITTRQADALFVFAIDDEKEEIRILQLDRDTVYVVDSSQTEKQLSLSFLLGTGGKDSADYTLASVLGILEIPIKNYCVMDMSGIETMFSKIGGVNLVVMSDLTWIHDTYTAGSEILLNGTEAYDYIVSLSDMYDRGNRGRMDRLASLLPVLMTTMKDKLSDGTISADEYWSALQDYLITNMAETEYVELFNKVSQYTIIQPSTPDGTSSYVNEKAEFYISEESLNELLIRLCYIKENKFNGQ